MWNQLNRMFQFFLQEEEIRSTCWAQWRYWDHPDFEPMLMMGGEL